MKQQLIKGLSTHRCKHLSKTIKKPQERRGGVGDGLDLGSASRGSASRGSRDSALAPRTAARGPAKTQERERERDGERGAEREGEGEPMNRKTTALNETPLQHRSSNQRRAPREKRSSLRDL